MRTLCCLTVVQFLLVSQASAAKFSEAIQASADTGKYTYIMFYRAEDSATDRMAAAIGQQVAKKSEDTSWVKISVTDAAAADVVKKYDASRLPMPTVIGLAPNGAVTGIVKFEYADEEGS